MIALVTIVCFLNFWLHPSACGTLFPQLEIEPVPPALEVGVLATGLLGNPYFYVFKRMMEMYKMAPTPNLE